MFNRFFTFPLSTINISNSKLNLVLFSVSVNMKGEDNGNPTSVSLLPSVSTVLRKHCLELCFACLPRRNIKDMFVQLPG